MAGLSINLDIDTGIYIFVKYCMSGNSMREFGK